MPILRADQFPIAFDFARSEAAAVRGADGVVRTLAANVPRFDHDTTGKPRGLLVTSGSDIGGQDRSAFDPLMLPAALTEGEDLKAREATVYHAFVPLAASQTEGGVSAASPEQFAAGIIRRAFYTREAARLIDALIRSAGHHLVIGTHAGFAENRDGFARYRGKLWQLPLGLGADGAALSSVEHKPLITSGALLAQEAGS
ncbi:hypothetical protein [Porphyrobacter sp. YT40]|uniref:hypothetical protein n=1 Tax=Porphyrobacter sp. YT40 TaxID=2547601 RepID=UPI0011418036|nr:hypothetical protein [Porphyrobacter sp. YT40]QDH35840.1 hypothetical protein E2E27_16865 [Porphyrobacter sp. YT40]